jgi:hypothetical protein
VDWPALADAWRARYQPQLETVRRGTRPWTKLDVLHREALDQVLADFALVLNLSKCAGLPWDAILGSEFGDSSGLCGSGAALNKPGWVER